MTWSQSKGRPPIPPRGPFDSAIEFREVNIRQKAVAPVLQGAADLGFQRLPGKETRHHPKVHAILDEESTPGVTTCLLVRMRPRLASTTKPVA